jgi:indolepyruvate ferredoxin oxidoreductase beta subunit
MEKNFQIVISGVGGQGVLFVTRLLAEAAIAKGLPVFTSETHGMAQRGGTVISHLKVGEFTSPLINPGKADGIIALKAECMDQHGGYLKPGGWATVNSSAQPTAPSPNLHTLDADRVARDIDDHRSVNLIMLGFTLAVNAERMFCSLDEVASVIDKRLSGKAQMLNAALRAINAGGKGVESA